MYRGLWWPCVKRGQGAEPPLNRPHQGQPDTAFAGVEVVRRWMEPGSAEFYGCSKVAPAWLPSAVLRQRIQVPLIEGLAQKADRACIEHTPSELFLREGCRYRKLYPLGLLPRIAR